MGNPTDCPKCFERIKNVRHFKRHIENVHPDELKHSLYVFFLNLDKFVVNSFLLFSCRSTNKNKYVKKPKLELPEPLQGSPKNSSQYPLQASFKSSLQDPSQGSFKSSLQDPLPSSSQKMADIFDETMNISD